MGSEISDLTTILFFVVLGLVGGVIHIMVDAEKWADLKKFSAFKRSVIGALCGFLYFFLFSDHDFPNAIMTIAAGYIGTDFIKGIIERIRKK